MKAKVYFNLHHKKFSIMICGRVSSHANSLLMYNCTFKVSEAGRQRVLRQGRKNVHAFVVGEILLVDYPVSIDVDKSVEVSYNPYKYNSFVTKDDEQAINHAETVFLTVVDKRPYIFVKEQNENRTFPACCSFGS